jgi:hypothetical protein
MTEFSFSTKKQVVAFLLFWFTLFCFLFYIVGVWKHATKERKSIAVGQKPAGPIPQPTDFLFHTALQGGQSNQYLLEF